MSLVNVLDKEDLDRLEKIAADTMAQLRQILLELRDSTRVKITIEFERKAE